MRIIQNARSREEAYSLHAADPHAVYYAGGSEILSLESTIDKASALIPLSPLSLGVIELREDMLYIGAMATFSDLIDSPIVPSCLKEAARGCASLQHRNRATIGGNIALYRPDSYLLPVLLAYEASIVIYTEKGESIRALKKENLTDNPLILGILIPFVQEVKLKSERLTSSSHASVTVAVGPSICVLGFAHGAIVEGADVDEALSHITLSDDNLYGTASYRTYLAKEFYREIKGVNA